MRPIAANVLIVVAVLGAVAAVLLAAGSVVEMSHTYPTSDRYAAAEGMLLLAGALLGLAAIAFLAARQLRQPAPGAVVKAPGSRRRGRLLPLVLYLGGSIALGILPAVGPLLKLPPSKPLAFLIGQPTFAAEILLGGFLGLRLEGAARPTALVVSSLLYFAAFLYPVYSMVVMDRAVEVARYRRLRTILILFGSVHLLIGLAFAAVLRA
jgi:hypothetical protein